ncbi:YqhG family protein [Caldibacillus lycopersici]|uniref:YqhG family protein n=1 Tax=Perspicuibacillus lycopersici TaxID=1325689 RepID=A0AAE3LQT4_9BACI|nr:YqhG family protein [Perspicuibacillus lycopersici]MCU9613854.1 YqhG family protein [Perspicuibacillus lycopersici]
MKQQEIHSFLNQFFTANDCEIENHPGQYLSVQLTIDMDKALMNRPFYWHYVEKTGGVPNPQKLTLITDYEKAKEIKGELIHFGSPRLHQIFAISKRLGGFIRLFEDQHASISSNIPLIPWLCINMKISYCCDRKKDSFRSIGLNLINGAMAENFQDQLNSFQNQLVAKIPDFCFTLSPLIKPQSGLRRIEQYITNDIEKDDHSWADEARKRWQEDEKLLNHFYEDMEEKPESYYSEKEALQEQYEPKITVSIINGGIFYLAKQREIATLAPTSLYKPSNRMPIKKG